MTVAASQGRTPAGWSIHLQGVAGADPIGVGRGGKAACDRSYAPYGMLLADWKNLLIAGRRWSLEIFLPHARVGTVRINGREALVSLAPTDRRPPYANGFVTGLFAPDPKRPAQTVTLHADLKSGTFRLPGFLPRSPSLVWGSFACR